MYPFVVYFSFSCKVFFILNSPQHDSLPIFQSELSMTHLPDLLKTQNFLCVSDANVKLKKTSGISANLTLQ